MKKEMMNAYEAPVTEVIKVEITPIMEGTTDDGGNEGGGGTDIDI